MTDETPVRIKKSIADATVLELHNFAVIDMGLDGIKINDKRETIIAKLAQAGYGLSTITVPNPAAAVVLKESGAPAMNRRVAKDGTTEVRIILHRTDKAGGSRPVPVGVNGKIMLIPRGESVWVPEAYVEVLQNAIEFQYPPYDGETDFLGGLKDPEQVPAYPFSS